MDDLVKILHRVKIWKNTCVVLLEMSYVLQQMVLQLFYVNKWYFTVNRNITEFYNHDDDDDDDKWHLYSTYSV